MKKHLSVLILISIFVPFLLTAQVGKLVGTVVDQETGKALEGANIWIPETEIGAASDANGKFFLPCPPGKYTFKVSVLGYKTVVLNAVEIKARETTTLNVKLAQTILESEPVIFDKSKASEAKKTE